MGCDVLNFHKFDVAIGNITISNNISGYFRMMDGFTITHVCPRVSQFFQFSLMPYMSLCVLGLSVLLR